MTEQAEKSIRFYEWEGDACRIHECLDGSCTADLYRSGQGLVAVSANDVIYGGKEIGEKKYKELVLEEIALAKKRSNS